MTQDQAHGQQNATSPMTGAGGDAPPSRRPGRGDRPPRGDGPRGGRRSRDEDSPYDEQVVNIYRCATVVKGGRRFSFAALVVVGDRKGQVGVGYGKANEVPAAVEKAVKAARRSLRTIAMKGTTIPHRVVGRYGASRVIMVPASEGTGVIAGASVRPVLELAGIKDVLTKSHGSTCARNLTKAALAGLLQMRTAEMVQELRGVSIGA